MYDFRDHGVNFGMSNTCPITLRSLLNMLILSCADKIRVSRHTSTRLCRFTRFMNKDGLDISNKSTLLSHVYNSACPGSRFFIVLIWQ